MNTAPAAGTRWVALLWFPLFFATAMSLIFIPAFSRPAPHQLPIGVTGTANQASALQAKLDAVHPGGFVVIPYADAATATDAVTSDRLAAALVGSPAQLLVATAASKTRADYLTAVLATETGATSPRVVDVRPRPAGDASGAGVFFYGLPLLLVGMVTSIVLVQHGTRSMVTRMVAIAATGSFASVVAWTVATSRDILPTDAGLLAYGFLLTQIVGWTTTAAAILAKPYFLPISMTFVLLAGIPTSGGTVPADMLPAGLAQLHAALPFAQFIETVRASSLASAGVLRPVSVLLAWALATAALIAYARRRTRTVPA